MEGCRPTRLDLNIQAELMAMNTSIYIRCNSRLLGDGQDYYLRVVFTFRKGMHISSLIRFVDINVGVNFLLLRSTTLVHNLIIVHPLHRIFHQDVKTRMNLSGVN
jgi:hypothetical protein